MLKLLINLQWNSCDGGTIKRHYFLKSLQRWTHPPLLIDKLKGSFWAWIQPMRGNLLCNTISNCLSPYPGWSSQSLWDHGVSQWEIKPSLNLAGAIPRMITDNLKLLSFNHILYIIIWVQLKSSIWSVGPVQVVRNPRLQSGALPSTNYYYLRNNHAQW